MYWQDKYSSPGEAVTALKEVLAGKRRMTPAELHVAQVASRSGLSGISEDPNNLGAICALTEQPHNLGGLKKDIKSALKSTNVEKIQSALSREQAKIDKAPDSKKAPKRVEYVKQLQAQLAVASAPKTLPAATVVLPDAPPQPIPTLPDLTGNAPAAFNQTSSGGFVPAPVPGEVVTEESWLTMPVMIGIGVAGLAVLFLLLRRK